MGLSVRLMGVSRLSLFSMKDTGMGLKAVKNITERQGLAGVYGPLYGLFEVPDENYNTAIELTAGNR